MSELDRVRENNGTEKAKQYYTSAVTPPVDVFENADELLVVADIPGVPGTGVDVRVENGTLTLEAKRSAESTVDFARSFRIPPGIDVGAIDAEVKNGTVVVRLPKAAAVKARKIAVRSA